jgi:hypothetical protein
LSICIRQSRLRVHIEAPLPAAGGRRRRGRTWTREADASGAGGSRRCYGGQRGASPARDTNQISETLGAGGNERGLIFGNWQNLAIGIWGNELEIVVDVVTKAANAQIVITSYSMVDTAILRPESFCKGTGATIS